MIKIAVDLSVERIEHILDGRLTIAGHHTHVYTDIDT